MLRAVTNRRIGTLALAAASLAFFPAPSFAQIAGDDTPVIENATQGGFQFVEEEFDMGTVLQTERPEFEFKFTNVSAMELEIIKIVPSCGCTYTEMSKRKFAPGETGTLKVRYDPTNKFGPQNKTIAVTTSDPRRQEITLKLKATVEPAVIVEPRVVNFGSVQKDEQRTIKVEVTGRTEDFDATFATVQRTEILEVKRISEPEAVRVDGKAMRRVLFEVTLKPGAGVGRLGDLMSIRTNDPREPIVNCNIAGQIQPDVRAEPMVLAFGAVVAGSEFAGEFRLTHRLGSEFKVEKVEVKPNVTTVEVKDFNAVAEPVGTGSYAVKVTGTAPEGRIAQPLTGKILVYTDVAGEQVLEVPYALQVRIKPARAAQGGR